MDRAEEKRDDGTGWKPLGVKHSRRLPLVIYVLAYSGWLGAQWKHARETRMLVSALALLIGPWKLTQYPQMLFLTTTYPIRVLVGGYDSRTVYL